MSLQLETGIISHAEAKELAHAMIDRIFHNQTERQFRASIPVDLRHDTDVRLMAYIRQQEEREPLARELAKLAWNLEQRQHPHAGDCLCIQCDVFARAREAGLLEE